MAKKGLLALIVLAQILNAYDFNASNFTGTSLNDFKKDTHDNKIYYLYNDNSGGTQAGQSANGGLNIGFIFEGNNAYLYNGNLFSNPMGQALESTNLFIYGQGTPDKARYIYFDLTNSNLSYTDLQNINLRAGNTTQGIAKEYLVLNMRYRGADGLIKNGLYFSPSTDEGRMLLTMVGFLESDFYKNASLPNYTAPNAQGATDYAFVNASSKFILRGTSVFDNIAQELFSHDILFGNALDSEIYPNAVRTAVFYGDSIDFSGNVYEANGNITTTPPRGPNTQEQTITLNSASAIDKNSIAFKIGSGTTNISLYNLGAKSVDFQNLTNTSKLNLTSIGSSIAGNITYDNANSLNAIFNNSNLLVNTQNSQNVALSSIISTGSRYLGNSNNGGTNAGGTITIGDNAQVSFIGADSHRFNGNLDKFAFNGTQNNTQNSVMFLNAGNVNGESFNVSSGSINFSVFGTSIQNLNITDTNTIKMVFDSTGGLWNSQGYNVAQYFQTTKLNNSNLSGTATLGDNVRATMVFNGANTFNVAQISGATADSKIFINGSNIGSQLNDYKGEVTLINGNFISALNTTAASASKYTHIFNGLSTNLQANLSNSGKVELNKILNSISTQSGDLVKWGISDIRTLNALNGVKLDSSKKMDLVFIGADSVVNSDLNVNTNTQGGLYHYTFIDFGEIDLSTNGGVSPIYGNAVVTMAGNTFSKSGIGVAYVGELDVSLKNRNKAQSFFGKNVYGETTKDITFNFGGDKGQRNTRFHQGLIVEGDKSSRYIFNDLDTINLTRPVSVNELTATIQDGGTNRTISVSKDNVSSLQKHLVTNGINFYVDAAKYGVNGTDSSTGSGTTIGFKNTNIIGNLTDDKFNIDAVFNSSQKMDEVSFLDSENNVLYGITSVADIRKSSLDGKIMGDTTKRITFIGAQSFNEKNFSITGGTENSVYNFYSIGQVNQELMGNILNAQDSANQTNDGAKGSFSFAGDTQINANIIKNATENATNEIISIGKNVAQNQQDQRLTEFAQGVFMSGKLSGSMKKDAIFAQGSSVIVKNDSQNSIYNFSLSGVRLDNNLAPQDRLIVASLDFTGYTQAAQIVGINGNTSIAGVFKNSTIGMSAANANQIKFTSSTNGSGGHWFVPESTNIDSVILQNDFNLIATSNAMSQNTIDSQLAIVDLATYNWEGYKYSSNGVAQLLPNNSQDEPDFYKLKPRDLGTGFERKTFGVMPTSFTNQNNTQYRSLFDSTNGVFRLGVNIDKKSSDEILILSTHSLNDSNNFLQLMQSKFAMREYEYDGLDDKIYLATAAVYGGGTSTDSVISDNLFSADNAASELSTQGIFQVNTQISSETLTLDPNSEFAQTIKAAQPNINITDYRVKRWYLQSLLISGVNTAALESSADSAKSSFGMAYSSIFAETNNLAKRMGELRASNDSDGSWAKLTKSGINGEGGFYGHSLGVQGGFDKKSESRNGNRIYLGLVGGVTQNWSAHNGIDSKSNVISIGAYRSAINANGSYTDLVGKYMLLMNSYKVNTPEFSGSSSPTSHAGYVSAEYGKRFGIKGYRGVFLQPSAELILGVVGEQKVRLNTQFSSYGATMSYRQTFLAIAKAGADLMGHFKKGTKAGYWRVGASLVRDIGNRGRVEVSTDFDSTTATKTMKADTQVLLSTGLDYRVSRDLRIYVEADRGFFGTYNVDYLISAGVRYNFGAKASRKPAIQNEFEQMQYIQPEYY